MFKKGQPRYEDLMMICAQRRFVIDWKSLGMMLGYTNRTSKEINESNPNKKFGVLRKWSELLGSGASYRGIALLLDIVCTSSHVLVETICHEEGK